MKRGEKDWDEQAKLLMLCSSQCHLRLFFRFLDKLSRRGMRFVTKSPSFSSRAADQGSCLLRDDGSAKGFARG